MRPVDIIIILVLAAIVGAAAWYVYKSKKSGRKCIGCPDGCCSCASKEGGCSGNCGGCTGRNRS